MKFSFLLFIMIMVLNLNADDQGDLKKIEGECHLASLEFKKNFHIKPFQEKFSDCLLGKKNLSLPLTYRQLHLHLAVIFYGPRKDLKEAALEKLSQYQCENHFSCQEFKNYLEMALKPKATLLDNFQLAKIKKIAQKINIPENKRVIGLCSSDTPAASYMAEIYNLYCTTWVEKSNWFFLSEEAFRKDLLRFSRQELLSSSRLMVVRHSTEVCNTSWTSELKCEGGVTHNRKIRCERAVDSVVKCVEI